MEKLNLYHERDYSRRGSCFIWPLKYNILKQEKTQWRQLRRFSKYCELSKLPKQCNSGPVLIALGKSSKTCSNIAKKNAKIVLELSKRAWTWTSKVRSKTLIHFTHETTSIPIRDGLGGIFNFYCLIRGTGFLHECRVTLSITKEVHDPKQMQK